MKTINKLEVLKESPNKLENMNGAIKLLDSYLHNNKMHNMYINNLTMLRSIASEYVANYDIFFSYASKIVRYEETSA